MGYASVPDSELLEWRRKALVSIAKAEKASDKYNAAKPGVIKHIKDSPHIYGAEDYNQRRALRENWTLSDAQDEYSWHNKNASMYHKAIMAELALRQMPEEQ